MDSGIRRNDGSWPVTDRWNDSKRQDAGNEKSPTRNNHFCVIAAQCGDLFGMVRDCGRLPRCARNDGAGGLHVRSEVIFCILWRTLDVFLCIKDYVMNRQPAVYILTNRQNGTLYTGVTSDLPARVWQHKNKVTRGFSAKYNLTNLVYFELFEDMYHAISREKQIKAGSRKVKIGLIEGFNPGWRDLYGDICG